MDKNDELVERILRLSRDPLLRTSSAASLGPPDLESLVTPEDIETAEAALGFALPELLRQLYLRVGNGGFGPGCGIIGLDDGYREDLSGACLPELYQGYREAVGEDLDLPPWPEKLLPLFVTGGSFVDSVDCSTADYLIVEGTDDGFRPTGIRFYDWMERWATEMESKRSASGIRPRTN